MSLNPAAAVVARRLKQQGFSNAQIAGVLGNFAQESGFNPRVNEGGKVGGPMGRGGYGLAQWTGGRQSALVNFAKQRKKDPGDPELQADFLVYELQGPESRAAASLRKAQSPEQAALVFRRDFERAGIPKDEVRMKAARDYYGKVGQLDQGIDFSRPALPGEMPSVLDTLRNAGLEIQPKDAEEQAQSVSGSLLNAFKAQVLSNMMPGGLITNLMPGGILQ
jgi:hypothetical protein